MTDMHHVWLRRDESQQPVGAVRADTITSFTADHALGGDHLRMIRVTTSNTESGNPSPAGGQRSGREKDRPHLCSGVRSHPGSRVGRDARVVRGCTVFVRGRGGGLVERVQSARWPTRVCGLYQGSSAPRGDRIPPFGRCPDRLGRGILSP